MPRFKKTKATMVALPLRLMALMARSVQAKAFIQFRLREWESERASIATLGQALSFYRFVNGSRRERPVGPAFQLGKNARWIREEVAHESLSVTSQQVVALVKDLEPYGARCEDQRKKGIMLKLPTGDPERPYLARFIHLDWTRSSIPLQPLRAALGAS